MDLFTLLFISCPEDCQRHTGNDRASPQGCCHPIDSPPKATPISTAISGVTRGI